ncbi:uncharacterized protein LOC135809734 [Sycon ciliatum]|uniref:uncharacterized protein LOC135809734 n=1 Tax=Sycon ciliatum TaxID=27933 RepID=UPI0031F6EBDE
MHRTSPLALSPSGEEPSRDMKLLHPAPKSCRSVSEGSMEGTATDSSLGYGTLTRKKSSTGSRYSTGSSWSRRSSSASTHSSFTSSKRSSRTSFGDISASESSDGSLTPRSLPAIFRVRSASASSSDISCGQRPRGSSFGDDADTCKSCKDSDNRQLSSYWSGEDGVAENRVAEQERELEEAVTELAIERGRTAKMANMLEEQEKERLLFACRTLHGVEVMKKEFEKLNKANEKSGVPAQVLLPPGLNTAWKSKTSLPCAVENPNCTLWNGDIIVGGHTSHDATAVVLRYNVILDTWSAFPTQEWIRVDSVFTHDDDLYIMTQTDIQTPGAIYRWTEKTEADGEDTWQHVTTLPSAHGLGSAVCVGSQLIVTGGVSGNRYSVAVDVFQFSTRRWSCLPNMKTKRCFHSSLAQGNDVMFIYGGTCSGGASESCSVEQFDLNQPSSYDTVVKLPHLASSLAHSTSLFFSCGGLEEQSGKMTPSAQFSVWSAVDPAKMPVNEWVSLPQLSAPRAHTALCFTSPKTVLAIGGAVRMSVDDADEWSTAVEELTIP